MQNLETPNDAAPKPAPWNKGKLIGPKPPLRPKHVWSIPHQAAARSADTRLGHVQCGDRQQAARLRCRQTEGGGRGSARAYFGPGNGAAKEDWPAGQIRADRANPGGNRRLHQSRRQEARPIPLRVPWRLQPSHLDQAVCPAGVPVDFQYWPEPKPFRNALAAPNKSHADLPSNRKPAGGPAIAGESTVRYLGIEVEMRWQ